MRLGREMDHVLRHFLEERQSKLLLLLGEKLLLVCQMHQLHESIRILLKKHLKVFLYMSVLVVLLDSVNVLDELI